MFVDGQVYAIYLVAFLSRVTVFVVTMNYSQVTPSLYVNTFSRLIKVIMLVIVFYFTSAVLSLLMENPISGLIVDVVVSYLFATLYFFYATYRFPIIVMFVNAYHLSLFFLVLAIYFIYLFLYVTPIMPIFPT